MSRKLFAFMAFACAVSACAGYRPDPRFTQELNSQYQALASAETEKLYDASDAAYFKHKGKDVIQGKTVQPEDPTVWGVPSEYLPELIKAHDALDIALTMDEKRITQPIPAAQAQAAYDCWVEQAQEKWTPQTHMSCRAKFKKAMCAMYKGDCIVMDKIYRVFFASGSTAIDAEGKQAIAKAIAAYKAGSKEVIVAGHADRVGKNDANMDLSKRRAEAVKTALQKGGISDAKIDKKYFGEEQPLVPTKDNVPNRNNRHVLIVVR